MALEAKFMSDDPRAMTQAHCPSHWTFNKIFKFFTGKWLEKIFERGTSEKGFEGETRSEFLILFFDTKILGSSKSPKLPGKNFTRVEIKFSQSQNLFQIAFFWQMSHTLEKRLIRCCHVSVGGCQKLCPKIFGDEKLKNLNFFLFTHPHLFAESLKACTSCYSQLYVISFCCSVKFCKLHHARLTTDSSKISIYLGIIRRNLNLETWPVSYWSRSMQLKL